MRRVHGGEIYNNGIVDEEIIDFSVSLNPLGMPNEVLEEAICAVKMDSVYPDVHATALKNAISKKLDICADHIIVTNGACEAIYSFVSALKLRSANVKDAKIICTVPTFGEYKAAALAYGFEVIEYLSTKEDGFLIKDDICDHIDDRTVAVFICNPNNPTGNLTDRELLLKILEKAKSVNAYLVVDECFMPFVEDNTAVSLIGDVDSNDNLVVIGAFTKIYAMAGLRLGMAFASDANLLNMMSNVMQPWNTSNVAQRAGVKALCLDDYISETITYIAKEREYLSRELSSFDDVKVYESKANFICFEAPSNLYKKLENRKICVRSCSDFEGLGNGFIRIGIRKHEDNVRLIEAIRECIG